MTRRHVILLTYGEPPSASFLAQLRYSWRILLGLTRTVAPIPLWVLPFIALRRARLRRRLWLDERYTSPLEPITSSQVGRLSIALAIKAPAVDWRVHLAYEFRDPLLRDILDAIPSGEAVDVVPMYVTDSAFTHQIARTAVAEWSAPLTRRGRARAAPVRVLPPMDEATLASLLAQHVSHELAALGHRPGPDWALVLAAHGTLLQPARPIDTGREATERICGMLARRLQPDFGLVVNGWLNHVYGGRWTEPPIEEALRQVVEAGYRRVVYYPYGFVADNAESELEGRIALRGQPALEAVHLSCLNTSPGFLGALADELIAALPKS